MLNSPYLRTIPNGKRIPFRKEVVLLMPISGAGIPQEVTDVLTLDGTTVMPVRILLTRVNDWVGVTAINGHEGFNLSGF